MTTQPHTQETCMILRAVRIWSSRRSCWRRLRSERLITKNRWVETESHVQRCGEGPAHRKRWGLRESSWRRAGTGRPRISRGGGGTGRAASRGLREQGAPRATVGSNAKAEPGSRALWDRLGFENKAAAHWVQSRQGRKKTAGGGCAQPTSRKHKMLVKIRVVEAIKFVDLKYLGSDTA